jgi:hypothetical protein
MMIKVLNHGSGSCAKAINYLLNPTDHSGEAREDVKILSGDPDLVAKIADSLEFQNRYSSLVISFAPTDRPTEKQIAALIRDAETTLRGGLGNAIALTAVQHTGHNGRTDIHIITAKVDMQTMKAYNPTPPGWQKRFDLLRDYHNIYNGWSRPDDRSRTRLLQPGKTAMFNKVSLKETLHNDILEKVKAGFISNRSDMEKYLIKNIGATITRGNGIDYIGLEVKGVKIRLKGEMYGKQWSREKLLTESIGISSADKEQNRVRSEEDRAIAKAEAGEIRKRLSDEYKRICEYNTGIYRKPNKQNEIANQNIKQHADVADNNILGVHNNNIVHSNTAKVNKWQESWKAELQKQREERTLLFESHKIERAKSNSKAEVILAYMQKKASLEEAQKLQRDMYFKKVQSNTIAEAFDIRNYKAQGNNIFDKDGKAVAKIYDRSVSVTKTDPESLLAAIKVYQSMNGKAVRVMGNAEFKKKVIAVMLDNDIPIKNTDRKTMKLYADMVKARKQINELKENQNDRIGSDAREQLENSRKSDSSIANRDAEITRTNEAITRANSTNASGAKTFNISSKDEEKRMKTEIDLGDYIESQGWQYNNEHSGGVSKQYEKNGTKLVVAKDMTGQFLYWERGTNKGGSILDFEMKHNNARNLGFAKKAVRNLIGQAIPVHTTQARQKFRRSTPNTQKIANMWNELKEYNQPYLRNRGISLETEKKFDIREDNYGNACFKYQSIHGSDAFGIEKRSEKIRLFEEGSKKELWMSRVGTGKKTVIFAESPIDAISYEQLHGHKISGQRVYIATGGQIKKEQIEDIEKLMNMTQHIDSKIILAHDNDSKGNEFAMQIQDVVKQNTERAVPANKDWNEDLQAEIAKQKAVQSKAQDIKERAKQLEVEKSKEIEWER